MSYTLATLRTYVRDLTGVYSTDLIPDALVDAWINEAYFDVARQQEWPWLPVTTLTSGSSPAFAAEFHPLLAYRVAAKVLTVQADDTNRAQIYLGEYQTILDAMYQDNLQALATNTLSSQAGVVRYVRDLLGIYDDTVTDTVITNMVSEVYTDFYAAFNWPFAVSPVPYATDGIGRLLAYGAASRLAPRYGKPAEMVASFSAEYSSALSLLQQTQLTDGGTVTYSTRVQMLGFVRTLLNEYGKQTPTALINAWLSEEYVALAASKDWPWLETEYQATVTGGSNTVALPSGTKKVLEMFLVTLRQSGDPVTAEVEDAEPIYPVGSTLDGMSGEPHYRYDVAYDGTVRLTPTPDQDITVRVRYVQTVSGLTSDSSQPAFDGKFRQILPYRVAVRVLDYLGRDAKVRDTYLSISDSIFNDMVSEYLLDHSTEPLQLGGRGLETRKYLPWFRTA